MYVGQTARALGGHSAKRAKSKGKSGQTFRLAQSEIAPSASSLGGSNIIAPLGMLIAVQEVDQVQNERGKAVAQGRELLDLLDEVKLGLLSGRIDPSKIRHLEHIVERLPNLDGDKGLREVLDQIALRVKVELAKLRR